MDVCDPMADAVYIYFLAKKQRGDLFIGLTSNLPHSVEQIRQKSGAQKPLLVYYEEQASMEEAKERKETLMNWNAAWKAELVESQNPRWHDLYAKIKAA